MLEGLLIMVAITLQKQISLPLQNQPWWNDELLQFLWKHFGFGDLFSLCPDVCKGGSCVGEKCVLSNGWICKKLPGFIYKTSATCGKPQESCKRMTSCMTSCISRHRSVDISRSVLSNALTVSSPVASPTFCGYGFTGKCCNCLPLSWSSVEKVWDCILFSFLENWMTSMVMF